MTSKIKFDVFLHSDSEKEIKRLPEKVRNLVMEKINSLDFPFSIQFKHLEENYYRLRSGRYRIIYQIFFDKQIVVVIRVAFRKKAYKNYKK